MTYPRRIFRIGFDKLKKRGKLPKHPHKGFRSAFKNAVNKQPPYMKSQWNEDVIEDNMDAEQDLDWYYNEAEAPYDLPDFSYPDYKPGFGLKDQLGNVGEDNEEGLDIGSDPAWSRVVQQGTESLQAAEIKDPTNDHGNLNNSSNQKESWFSNFLNNLF